MLAEKTGTLFETYADRRVDVKPYRREGIQVSCLPLLPVTRLHCMKTQKSLTMSDNSVHN
jgi:hypothetical protein